MFNYTINWHKILRENIPYFFQTWFRLNWIHALVKPIKNINVEFGQVRQAYINKVAYNGQRMNLEKILNDKFDSSLRRIFITDSFHFNNHYLYKKVESKPPRYLHKKWNSATNYGIGQFSVEGNSIYKSLTNNLNAQPSISPTDWDYERKVEFLRKRSEYSLTSGFIVNVPTSLVYDDPEMRATINYYRLAGIGFIIITF